MKLTDEQIKEFEARAEAGEKPTEGFWERMPGLNLPVVYRPCLPFETLCKVYDWEWADGGTDLLVDGRSVRFSSIPAAQLAVEHLLREATQRLHAEAYWTIEELREWAVETLQAPRTGTNSHENAWLDGARHKAEGVLHRLPIKEKPNA